MIGYTLRRLLRALLTAAALVVAVALLSTVAGYGAGAPPSHAVATHAAVFTWLAGAARLDFGYTADNQPVVAAIAAAFPATLLLVILAVLMGLLVGWGGGLVVALASAFPAAGTSWSRIGRAGGVASERSTGAAVQRASVVPGSRRPRGVAMAIAYAQSVAAVFAQAVAGACTQAVAAVAEVGQGVPTFWLGGVLVALFSVGLGWLPPGGIVASDLPAFGTAAYGDALRAHPTAVLGDLLGHLVLPALTLALAGLATDLRLILSALPAELRTPHVRVARATGLPRRRLLWRAARPILPSIIAGSAAGAPLLASALVLVEYLFGWPGLGLLAYHAARAGDGATLGALLLLFGLAVIAIGLVSDVLAAWADPRLRGAVA